MVYVEGNIDVLETIQESLIQIGVLNKLTDESTDGIYQGRII